MPYDNARKALERIDEFADQTDMLLANAKTDADVKFWDHVCLMRNDYVRQAYLLDTAHLNRWSAIRCMPVNCIRDVVKKDKV